MGKMAKPKDRKRYAQNVERFLKDNGITEELCCVDIIIFEEKKVSLFPNTMCRISSELILREEVSYTLTFYWEHALAKVAQIDINTLPLEMKSCFDSTHYTSSVKELHITDNWKVSRHYFVYMHQDTEEYKNNLIQRVNELRKV